jgi:hypothetical protein
MTDTEDFARRYFRAWTARDRETVVALLSPDFRFAAGDMTIEGRDAFLASGAFPADAATTMVAEAYQGDIGFQMYDATRGDRSVRIVEQLTVRESRIVSSTFVADMAAFAAFASAGA